MLLNVYRIGCVQNRANPTCDNQGYAKTWVPGNVVLNSGNIDCTEWCALLSFNNAIKLMRHPSSRCAYKGKKTNSESPEKLSLWKLLTDTGRIASDCIFQYIIKTL